MFTQAMLRNAITICIICTLLLLSPVHGQAPLKGSIGPNGYQLPPYPISVTWRGSNTVVVKTLDRSQPFTGPGDFSKYLRYGAGDRSTIGLQIDGIGSEQNGMRCCLLLGELYRQKGITTSPACLGQAVFDFCIVEIGRGGGADWCDFKRFTGKEDPVCGAFCPPCANRGGDGHPPPGSIAEPATELRFEGSALHWKWAGIGRPNFTAYVRRESSFVLLGTSRSSPMRLTTMPQNGERIILYVRVQGIAQAAESQLAVGVTPVDPPQPPQPPPPPSPIDPPPTVCQLADVLPSTTLDALWTALSTTQREQLIVRALETLLKDRKELP